MKETACRHIEVEIGIDEVQRRIKSYYQSKTDHVQNKKVGHQVSQQMQGKYWTRTESDFVAKRSEHSTRHASTGQERSLIETDSVDVVRLVCVIGNGRLSVKAMMEVLELKGRDKFLNLYLNPAIQQGFVTMLYPNKPR